MAAFWPLDWSRRTPDYGFDGTKLVESNHFVTVYIIRLRRSAADSDGSAASLRAVLPVKCGSVANSGGNIANSGGNAANYFGCVTRLMLKCCQFNITVLPISVEVSPVQ